MELAEFIVLIKQIPLLLDFTFFCTEFAVSLLCNAAFVPCDMTTGAPKAICSDSCYFLQNDCSENYNQLKIYADAFFRYPIPEDCDNTLIMLQENFSFPCSSSSLGNDCLDLFSMFDCLIAWLSSNVLLLLLSTFTMQLAMCTS